MQKYQQCQVWKNAQPDSMKKKCHQTHFLFYDSMPGYVDKVTTTDGMLWT